MNTTHTQGPWIAEYRNRSYFDIFAPSAHAADSPRASKVAEICSNGNKSIDEMRANARLIAAAPTLLSALEWALTQIDDDLDPDHQAALNAARAMVSRARGTA